MEIYMDFLDRIARESASILELEDKDTMSVNEIHTSANLVLRDGKDGQSAYRPLLDLNLVR